MWHNYLTIGLRTLLKNRTYAFINVFGLAIGMAACVMILLYVRYEQSYDQWLPDAENTYQFQTFGRQPDTGEPFALQKAPYVTESRIRKDFPQIVQAGYILGASPTLLQDGEAKRVDDYRYADNDFLKTVNLPLLAGTTLTAPQTAVITQQEAIRRYGTDRVIGRTLTTVSRGVKGDFKIVGVLKDLPKNSHLKINAILRVDFNAFYAGHPPTCWGCSQGWVYAKLKPGADANQLNAQIPAWKKRNIPRKARGDGVSIGDYHDWKFTNVRDVHLGKAQQGAMTPGNDSTTIMTFAIVAMLILGMAIVNFTNLATARASQRAREVALRKVLGATRRQLIVQFIAESILISAVAMLLAFALVELLVGPFAAFLDADLTLHYLGRGGILYPAIGLTLVAGVAGGLYPALFLSRFRPAQVLKANRSAADTPGSGRLRAGLVVLQFAVSIGLIVCTAVVYSQTSYARTVDPGFRRDHILQVEELGRAQLQDKGEEIVQRMKRIPGVVAVGRGDVGISTIDYDYNNQQVMAPGASKPVVIGQYNVDEGFRDAMGLPLKAGRWFDPNRPMDDVTTPATVDLKVEEALAARGVNIVINEYAARKLGFKSPEDAIGKTARTLVFTPRVGMADVHVIGVVADSRFRSIRGPIDAIMFSKVREQPDYMMIRYRGDPAAVRAAVEREWRRIATDVPFNAKFSDDIMLELYRAEDTRAKTFAAFALLSVIVGCLGLFGLAAFTAERRTKEIGIRKVLGARVRDIVQLLVWQFSKPVIVANLIAWPVAWWVMRGWLNGFDARIALGPAPFLLAGGLALAIAIATVAGHAFRVARSNPVKALRYE